MTLRPVPLPFHLMPADPKAASASTPLPAPSTNASRPAAGALTPSAAVPASSSSAATATGGGDREKALGLVLNQIERNFGKGSIMRLGDASRMRVETISTGALTLDLALGGGYPKGRVVEVYGPESSGKTTLTLHAIAEVQRRGGLRRCRARS